jgi:hypothetical protein
MEPVVEYVEEQFDKFLEAETRVKRESLPDSRVHACLFFIAPSGHGLQRIDVEFKKRIHNKVNIIQVRQMLAPKRNWIYSNKRCYPFLTFDLTFSDKKSAGRV